MRPVEGPCVALRTKFHEILPSDLKVTGVGGGTQTEIGDLISLLSFLESRQITRSASFYVVLIFIYSIYLWLI
jgi:hypothetical protein